MCLRGRRVGVIDALLFDLHDVVCLGGRIVFERVARLCAVRILEVEFLLARFDGFNQLFLELLGEADIAHNRVDDVAARVSIVLAVLRNRTFRIDLVGIVAEGEGSLLIGNSLQDGKLLRKGKALGAVCGTHGGEGGKGNGLSLARLRNDIEILARHFVAVLHTACGKARLTLALCEHELRLRERGESILLNLLVAKFRIHLDAGVLLDLTVRAIKELRLAVGRNGTADKGEKEHSDQDNHTDDGNAIPEETLGNHGTGRQGLHAAIIIQGVGRFLLILILVQLLLVFRHTGSSSLTRCARAGQPQRTGYLSTGYRSVSKLR